MPDRDPRLMDDDELKALRRASKSARPPGWAPDAADVDQVVLYLLDHIDALTEQAAVLPDPGPVEPLIGWLPDQRAEGETDSWYHEMPLFAAQMLDLYRRVKSGELPMPPSESPSGVTR